MDKFLDYRDPKQKYTERSSNFQAKILKGRLHFLGRQRDLVNADVYRHTCRGCGRVFHKQQGLEWHVSDEHPQLVEQLAKDLARCKVSSPPSQKRVMPQRTAAPRGTKRWRMSLEETVVKVEQTHVDSYSDIDGLLETSDDEEHSDIDKLLETTDEEEELGLQGLDDVQNTKKCQVDLEYLDLSNSTKKCQVKLEMLDLSKLDLNNNMDDRSDTDIVIESVSHDSENDIEVVYTGQATISPGPELVDISLSSHSVSSQPSQWSAPHEDTGGSTVVPRLRHAVDKVTWWLSTQEEKLEL